MTSTTIHRPSVVSLLVNPDIGNTSLSTATGFAVEQDGTKYLITNRHVVTGLHQETDQPTHSSGATPNGIALWHHEQGAPLGSWIRKQEPLHDSDGKPLWLVHPTHGSTVDVVALPLTDLVNVTLYTYPIEEPERMPVLFVSQDVFVIGFPYGITGGGAFGVWARGSVATELDLDYENLPRFLIDSRTRPGQSGSPVIQYLTGGTVTWSDGSIAMGGGVVEQIVGVYSGRIHSESDLGFVWKMSVVRNILSGAVRET